MTRKEYKIQYKQLKAYFKMQKNELFSRFVISHELKKMAKKNLPTFTIHTMILENSTYTAKRMFDFLADEAYEYGYIISDATTTETGYGVYTFIKDPTEGEKSE